MKSLYLSIFVMLCACDHSPLTNEHQSSTQEHHIDDIDVLDMVPDVKLGESAQALMQQQITFLTVPTSAVKAISLQWGITQGQEIQSNDLFYALLDQSDIDIKDAALNCLTVPLTWHEKHLAVSRIELENHVMIALIPSTQASKCKNQIPKNQIPTSHHIKEISLGWHLNTRPVHLDLIDQLPKINTRPILTETQVYALAPYEFVVSRQQWGARNPELICSDIVQPYRASVHHTASPADDGGDPALRMRQIQAFHIDSRGWCDIGYHFVVSQSGQIFEGRLDERRPGAHVGNQNSGNIGVSMIGNFDEQQVSATQFNALIKIITWIHNTYQIPLDNNAIKGHQQWPGQNTSCPGSHLLARLDELYERVESGKLVDMEMADVVVDMNVPTPTDRNVPPADQQILDDLNIETVNDQFPSVVDMAVETVNQGILFKMEALGDVINLNRQGQSTAVIDYFPTDAIQLRITLHNKENSNYSSIKLGIEQQWINAKYRVIGSNGNVIDMGDLGNEINIAQLPALQKLYIDIGGFIGEYEGLDPKIAKTWIKDIAGVYHQDQHGLGASLNLWADGISRESAISYDTISKDAWRFKGSDDRDIEGWFNCAQESSQRIENQNLLFWGYAPCLESPSWTKINASQWKQMVIKLSSNDHYQGVIRFVNQDRGQDSANLIIPSAGDWYIVVDFSNHTAWQNEIIAMRMNFVPISEGALKIQEIYMQNPIDQSTSLKDSPFVSQTTTISDLQNMPTPINEDVASKKESGCQQKQGHQQLTLLILLFFGILLVKRRIRIKI